MTRPSKKADILIDLFVGSSDGLIVALAAVAGLSVLFPPLTVVYSTLIILLLAAVAMAIARYFGERSLHSEEKLEQIVSSLGVEKDTSEDMLSEARKISSEWDAVMTEVHETDNAARSALNIALFYVLSGAFALLPLVLIDDAKTAVYGVFLMAALALFLSGFLKGKFTGQSAFSAGVTTLIKGALVALCAFGVASLFV